MTNEFLRHLIARILENAQEAAADLAADKKSEFKSGRRLAYYEVLDIIQAEAKANGLSLCITACITVNKTRLCRF